MKGKQFRVLLADGNAEEAHQIQEMLDRADDVAFQVHHADCLLAALDALTYHTFDVALVDISLPDSQDLHSLTAIQRHAPSLPVVLLTCLANEALALTALERGAQDYLVKGRLNTGALERVLQYAIVRGHRTVGSAQTDPSRAVVTGFLGAKGGVGTTTVACHYAVELQRQTQSKVLLLDLDTNSTSAAFLMRAQSKYSLIDACTNLYRLDEAVWGGLVHSVSEGVDLVQAPGAVRFDEQLDGERVRHVLRFARSLYKWVVVDLGRLNRISRMCLEEIRTLFVVTTPELASLYEASRVLPQVFDLGLRQEDTFLLLNRLAGALGGTGGDLEKALGYPVHATLPESGRELNEAYAAGQFLDRRLRLRSQIGQVVAKSLGVEPKPQGRGVLKFFSLART